MNAPHPLAVPAAPEADFAEIAEAMGVSERSIERRAIKAGWPFREQPVRGGKKRLFPLAGLPAEVRNALLLHYSAGVAAAVAVSPAPTFTASPVPAVAAADTAHVAAGTGPATALYRPDDPADSALTPHQIDVNMAQSRLIDFVDAYTGSAQRALDALNAMRIAGTLTAPLAWAYENAWDKPRANKQLNLSTLNKWKRIKKERGHNLPRRNRKDLHVKPWHALAIALVQRPQGGCKTWITEQIAAQWQPEWGHVAPSYDMICRFFRHDFSQIDQLKGRWSGSQLRAKMKYQHRDSSTLLPWDEVHADGWNTHFSAPHPVTGEYVTYEVWHAHDVATRFVPPFGVGLTENFEVIAKCIENTYRAGGCMLHMQTDSTRIVKNSERFKTNPATALAERAGFTFVHPVTVGNSQANGIAENFNTWLDKESRELATYQNPKRMDELSFKRGKKLTAAIVKAEKAGDVATAHAKRNELARVNKGLVLASHEQALAWLEAKRQKWNHKPHRALNKVRDPDTGTLRHETPFEAVMRHIDAGWEPSLPDLPGALLEQHLIDLFRPHLQLKVRRGTVTPYGGMRYEHDELPHWEGKDVVVAYDIMDWRQVWVKTLKGEPICSATFKEATGYRTLTAIEAAEEKRAQARIKNHTLAIKRIEQATPGMATGNTLEGESRAAILDYIEAEVVPIRVEREKTLLDFLPEAPAEEAARDLTFEETCALYMRRSDEDEHDGDEHDGSEEAPVNEAAAG